MVVDEDYAGSVGDDGGLEDFAGMNEDGVQGAMADDFPADGFAPGVQVDDDEVFHVGPEDDAAGELLEEVGRQNFRGVHGNVAHGRVRQAHNAEFGALKFGAPIFIRFHFIHFRFGFAGYKTGLRLICLNSYELATFYFAR